MLRRAVRPPRPGLHSAHRPLVPRGGAQRRTARLGVGPLPHTPDRRPGLPGARPRLVHGDRGTAARTRPGERRPDRRDPDRERAVRPAGPSAHAEASGTGGGAERAPVDVDRLGRGPAPGRRAASALRRLSRGVLDRGGRRLARHLPQALLLHPRARRRGHRRRPAAHDGARRRSGADGPLPVGHLRAGRRDGRGVPPAAPGGGRRHRRARAHEDRLRFGVAGLLHVPRGYEPDGRVDDPPGVARHRLPQRPAGPDVRLPGPARRVRPGAALLPRTAPAAPAAGRVRAADRPHGVRAAGAAAHGAARPGHPALGGPQRRHRGLPLRDQPPAARAAAGPPGHGVHRGLPGGALADAAEHSGHRARRCLLLLAATAGRGRCAAGVGHRAAGVHRRGGRAHGPGAGRDRRHHTRTRPGRRHGGVRRHAVQGGHSGRRPGPGQRSAAGHRRAGRGGRGRRFTRRPARPGRGDGPDRLPGTGLGSRAAGAVRGRRRLRPGRGTAAQPGRRALVRGAARTGLAPGGGGGTDTGGTGRRVPPLRGRGRARRAHRRDRHARQAGRSGARARDGRAGPGERARGETGGGSGRRVPRRRAGGAAAGPRRCAAAAALDG